MIKGNCGSKGRNKEKANTIQYQINEEVNSSNIQRPKMELIRNPKKIPKGQTINEVIEEDGSTEPTKLGSMRTDSAEDCKEKSKRAFGKLKNDKPSSNLPKIIITEIKEESESVSIQNISSQEHMHSD